MRVLLYGGTFDPPHEGHINLLRSAAQAVQPDRTILMPAGVPPHKAASATPAPLRLAMCRCFVQAWPGVQISDWEISRKGKSYTIDTVRMLGQRYPGARLYLCVGGDPGGRRPAALPPGCPAAGTGGRKGAAAPGPGGAPGIHPAAPAHLGGTVALGPASPRHSAGGGAVPALPAGNYRANSQGVTSH